MKRILVVFIIIFLMIPIEVFANTAEPPNIVIIVEDLPEGDDIQLISSNQVERVNRVKKGKEVYFAIYFKYTSYIENQEIRFQSSTGDFSIELPVKAFAYNTHYTLDYNSHQVSEGKSLIRSIKLISLRVSLTLLIEGFVFYLYKFRQKRSWLAFAVVNLLTQGYVNYILQGESPITPASYVFFSLVLLEFVVLIIEAISLPYLIKERRRAITFSCVLLANLMSFLLGGWMITNMPI